MKKRFHEELEETKDPTQTYKRWSKGETPQSRVSVVNQWVNPEKKKRENGSAKQKKR